MSISSLGRHIAMTSLACLQLAACRGDGPKSTEPVSQPTALVAPSTRVELRQLEPKLWLHTSTRDLPGFPGFVSHGLVIRGSEGLLLIDGAWGEAATQELLSQISREIGEPVRAAVLSDFHDDRAGGARVLAAAGVPVYSSPGVFEALAPEIQIDEPQPLKGPLFRGELAGVQLELFSPGAGHSGENLVIWVPQHELLFGGCLIRPMESRSLGNTADADLDAWGPSVRAVQQRYPAAKTVVPSHGKVGDSRLLEHTRALVRVGLDARALSQGREVPLRVAITVDDLPQHGPLPPGRTRSDLHAQLLQALKAHRVPDVRGYLIGQHAQSTPDNEAALGLWLEAGYRLGNHTWSHPNMEEIGVEAYLEDIDRNEGVLAELTQDAEGRNWRSFRYPYLRQGFDKESTTKVRAHLAKGGYEIAEVTIDFWDWDYQAAYVRCVKKGSEEGVKALRKTFRQRAIEMLEWHRQAAQQAFGRPIPQVLLLHAGAFTAEMMEELLSAYEARGVEWISVAEALADPVYRDVPLPPRTHGDVLVEQAVATLGVEHPPWPSHPGALLHQMCR